MFQVKIKSGGHVTVLGEGDAPQPGICFSLSEWELTKRLSSALDDEEQRGFWETILKKKEDPSYCVFEDFPDDLTTKQESRAPIGIIAEICEKEAIKARGKPAYKSDFRTYKK